MMETPWYFRLFYVNILLFVISFLLSGIIGPKRMGAPEPKSWVIVSLIFFIIGCVLMWFTSFSIDLTFWIGLCIIIIGEVVYALGFIAMREHPEKKKVVVDWGIYKVSRHSHIIAGIICVLGVIVMGWNPESVMYMILWIYFVIFILMNHFYVLGEEKVNLEKFGQEYRDYMRKTPQYIGIQKSRKND